MKKTILLSRQSFPFLLISIAFLLAVIFTKLACFQNNLAELSIGLTLDLVVTIPLFYLLLIRGSSISKTTVIPVFILGLFIGYQVVPTEEQMLLDKFKLWVLPVIEIGFITYLGFKIRSIYRTVHQGKTESTDFFTLLKTECYKILPKRLVVPFATEMATIYYGFINWKSYKINKNQFTYHIRSGSMSLYVVLIMIIVIETFAVHIVLSKWSSIAANILTILSVYTLLQLIGFARSLKQRPITITDNQLKLRYGIMNESDIQLSEIVDITFSRASIEKDETAVKLSQLGELESHNVILEISEAQVLHSLYGFKKSYSKIAFHVDDKQAFKTAVEESIAALKN